MKEMRRNRIKWTSSRMTGKDEFRDLESGEKYVNEFMFAVKMCLTNCGVENCAVRFAILLMKNVVKSSAVKVDEGGGGGRKRREENVLKSM